MRFWINDHLAGDLGTEGPFSGFFKKIWWGFVWSRRPLSEIWWGIFVGAKAFTHFVRNFCSLLKLYPFFYPLFPEGWSYGKTIFFVAIFVH
jgi:hypothetical protein